jgi:hypothetical protein
MNPSCSDKCVAPDGECPYGNRASGRPGSIDEGRTGINATVLLSPADRAFELPQSMGRLWMSSRAIAKCLEIGLHN